MALDTGKIVEVIFENAVQTFEEQTQLLDLVTVYNPNGKDLQNTSSRAAGGSRDDASSTNVVWRPVEQQAPVIEGFDLTSYANGSDLGLNAAQTERRTGIIEQYYPAALELPKNDYIRQPVEDLRDMQFWARRGKKSGRKQASYLNNRQAQLIRLTGSIYYRLDASGYDFVNTAQTILNERQVYVDDGTYIHLNTRTYQAISSDLANRSNMGARTLPEDAYRRGMVGEQVAGFDRAYRSSFLGTIRAASSAVVETTVTADQTFRPEGSTPGAALTPAQNIDYRIATIPVADSSNYQVGDKVTFENAGTPVFAVGLDDKSLTNQPMTFSVVAIPSGTSISVYPKPIALDFSVQVDPVNGLTEPELAYANVNTRILSGAAVVIQNKNTAAVEVQDQASLFWCKDSIEVMAGQMPVQLLNEFGGMKVVSTTMKNGLTMYLAYDGDLEALTFRCRLVTWWGLTNVNPSANGVCVYTGTSPAVP